MDMENFCPICSGLSEKIITDLLKHSIIHSFKAHDYIYLQDSDYRGIYVITKGEVELSNVNEDGKKVFVSKIKMKMSFGESGRAKLKYLENTYALTDVTCIYIPEKTLSELADKYSEFSSALLTSLNEWLVTFYDRFKMLSQDSIRKRLELYLENESQIFKSDEFELGLRKHQIASNLGIRPETLSRLFKELSDQGLISIQGKRVNISLLKSGAKEKMCESSLI